MAQMRMKASIDENLEKTVQFMERAAKGHADLIFFPEIQISPFFPQYEGRDAFPRAMTLDGPEITAIRMSCRRFHLFSSPNVYLELNGKRYDVSLMIDAEGQDSGNIQNGSYRAVPLFYEQDYDTPSEDGFKIYNTLFGCVGVVICFDRHPQLRHAGRRPGVDSNLQHPQ